MLEYDIACDVVDALNDTLKEAAARAAKMVVDTFKQHSLPIRSGIDTSKQYQMVRLCVSQMLGETLWMHMAEEGILIMFEEMKKED